MKVKPKPDFPDPQLDPTIMDEPQEELWDNVFLQQQFIHLKDYNAHYSEVA